MIVELGLLSLGSAVLAEVTNGHGMTSDDLCLLKALALL